MLTLRPAVFDDNAFIRSVFEAALPLYEPLLPRSFPGNLTTLDILTAKQLDFSATGLDGWILLAGGSPVGFAGIGPLNARQAYMAALYFLPAHQRRGYGRQALARLEADYSARGYAEMLLLVHLQAPWARNFYLAHGYAHIAANREAIIAYGGHHLEHLAEPGLVLMAKPLNIPMDMNPDQGQDKFKVQSEQQRPLPDPDPLPDPEPVPRPSKETSKETETADAPHERSNT